MMDIHPDENHTRAPLCCVHALFHYHHLELGRPFHGSTYSGLVVSVVVQGSAGSETLRSCLHRVSGVVGAMLSVEDTISNFPLQRLFAEVTYKYTNYN
jgi:hypothetical protein